MFCLPNTLPDELIFSRLVRYLAISKTTASKCLLTVYGNPKVCIHPSFTAGLKRLAELVDENSQNLLNQQTLAPVLMICLPTHATEISQSLLSNNNYAATRTTQLFCFREREPLTLKYCPKCVSSDIENFGVAYWHRSHQIPGIESCSQHSTWLMHVDLPDRIRTNVGLPPSTSNSVSCSKLGFELAMYANQFMSMEKKSNLIIGFENYQEKLRNLGYLTKSERVRRQWLLSEFYKFALELNYPSNCLLPKSETDYKYLSNLLRKNTSQQPYKHILFSFWLSGAQKIPSTSYTKKNISVTNPTHLKQMCIQLLKQGSSIASVSRTIGKSRCFVKAIALKENIVSTLKPTKLIPSVRQAVVMLARKGFHRKEIARRLSISVGSVEMLISTTNGLVLWRKQCKKESKRRRHQLQIIRYRQHHPNAIRNEIKHDCNAAFFWLYSHERKWLETNLPKATKPHPPKIRVVVAI